MSIKITDSKPKQIIVCSQKHYFLINESVFNQLLSSRNILAKVDVKQEMYMLFTNVQIYLTLLEETSYLLFRDLTAK